MTTTFMIKLITFFALQQGIDPNIAISVAKIESNFNMKAVGPYGEIGIFQVRPEYSKYSKKELVNAETNIKEGLRILKTAMKSCKHQTSNKWLVCYNAGVTGGSSLKFPSEFAYYKKVQKEYNRLQKNTKIVGFVDYGL